AGDIERCRQWVDVEVRYSDLDAQGRVNNAIFFTYFEQARVAFLAEMRARGLEHLQEEEGANSPPVSSPEPGDGQLAPGGATGVGSAPRIEAADIPYVIASASCVYSKPIMSLAPIEIGVYCSEMGRVSFEVRYVVCDRGRRTVYATGTTLIVNVDVETGRPRMLPEWMRWALAG
ncbi:MAG: acyl-CoA thioesterase, partial [Ktedonobacterales bacterium]